MCANNSAIDGPGSIALSCNPPSGTARSKPKSHLCVAWIEAVFIRALSRGLGAREAARDRNRAEGHLTRGCRAGNSQDRKNGSRVPLISRPTLGPETAPKNLIATRVPGCRGRVARTFLSASLVRLDAETLLGVLARVNRHAPKILQSGRQQPCSFVPRLKDAFVEMSVERDIEKSVSSKNGFEHT